MTSARSRGNFSTKLITKPAKRQGISIFYQDKPLTSIYDPIKEADRIWHSQYERKLKSVTQRMEKQCPNIIFLGAPPYYPILHALQIVDVVWIIDANSNHTQGLSDLLEQLLKSMVDTLSSPLNLQDKKLIIYQDVSLLIAEWSQLENVAIENLLKNLFFIESSYADKEIHLLNKEKLIATLKERLQAYNTDKYFNWIWHINALKQLTRIETSGNTLSLLESLRKNLAKNKRDLLKALLIASGLSTEEKIDEIKAHAEDAVVCCLPSMYAFLKRQGVAIDLIVSSDGGYYNHLHFEKIAADKVSLIAPLSLYEGITRRFSDVFYYIDLEEHWNILKDALDIDSSNFIPMQGTVINSAFMCLHRLGFTDIMPYGVDFVITPFKFHTTSNTTEEIYFNTHTRLSPYENWMHPLSMIQSATDGTYTDDKLKLYRVLFKETVKLCQREIYSHLSKKHVRIESVEQDNRALNSDKNLNKNVLQNFYDGIMMNKNMRASSNSWRENYLQRRFETILTR